MKEREGYTAAAFAAAIKEIRNQTGTTQQQLAKILNLSDQTIRLWEQAKRLPKSPTEKLHMIHYEIEQWHKWKNDVSAPRFRPVPKPNKELVEFVRNMRKSAKWTVSELAVKMGENEWDLLALEKGKKEPRKKDEFLKRLRKVTKEQIQKNRESRDH